RLLRVSCFHKRETTISVLSAATILRPPPGRAGRTGRPSLERFLYFLRARKVQDRDARKYRADVDLCLWRYPAQAKTLTLEKTPNGNARPAVPVVGTRRGSRQRDRR